MSVFKHYEPGEPTCRLYVKNVAKQVEEKVSVCSTDKKKKVQVNSWILKLNGQYYLFIYSINKLD